MRKNWKTNENIHSSLLVLEYFKLNSAKQSLTI